MRSVAIIWRKANVFSETDAVVQTKAFHAQVEAQIAFISSFFYLYMYAHCSLVRFSYARKNVFELRFLD